MSVAQNVIRETGEEQGRGPSESGRLGWTGFSPVWLLVFAVLLGAFLRIWVATGRPVDVDEAVAMNLASQTTFGDLMLWRHEEHNQPPFSYILLKLSLLVSGDKSLLAARLLPLLAGVFCIPAAYYLGCRVQSRWLGGCAALLAACDPVLVSESAEARMFSLLCLGTLLALILIIRLIQTGFRSKTLCLALAPSLEYRCSITNSPWRVRRRYSPHAWAR